MNKGANEWRSVGKRLYEKFRKGAEQEWEKIEKTIAAVREHRPTDGDLFKMAIAAAVAWGDLEKLIRFLESDRQACLSRSQREDLAYILTITPWKRKQGRQKDDRTRRVAADANNFYKEWQLANEEVGISNRGLGKEMRDEACLYAVESWNSLSPFKVDFETVRQMMDRSKTRQK